MKYILFLSFLFSIHMMMAQTDEVTGKLEPQQLASHWSEPPQKYVPASGVIAQLKDELKLKSVEVEVILGLWCEDSEMHVPVFIQLADSLSVPYTLTGINRNKECPLENCSNWITPRIPLFIVRSGEKELGRIIETPEGLLEEHLLKILRNKP
jgi:hypothetical protein